MNKIFPHIAPVCSCGGMSEYYKTLQQSNKWVAVYEVDSSGFLNLNENLGQTRIFRMTRFDYVPYHVEPTPETARKYWNQIVSEMDSKLIEPESVWLEIFNEPDKDTYAERVGEWMVALAKCALEDGRKVCGPGWAAGTPEPEHWRSEPWVEFFRLCSENPNQVALTLHEYSYETENIFNQYPWLIGRHEDVISFCKELGINAPTTFITETGWTLNDMPDEARAKTDLLALNDYYNRFPNIKAAFVWTLQSSGFQKDLANRLNRMIPFFQEMAMKWEPTPEPEPEPEKLVLGVDISKWQGLIDFDKMANRLGNGFVIVRSSYGKNRDERVDDYVPEIKKRGIPFSFYHYLHFFDSVSEQVEVFVDVIKKFGADFPVSVDVEDKNFNGFGVKERADFVLAFMVLLQAKLNEIGHKEFPLIYTNPSYWKNDIGSPQWSKSYPLWIANWTNRNQPIVPEPWENWVIWQWNVEGGGKEYGVQTNNIDKNRFVGGQTKFNQFKINLPPWEPEPEETQMLANPSFENGWETLPPVLGSVKNQRPNGWQINWLEPGDPLPHHDSFVVTGIAEHVHKPWYTLPENEGPGGEDALILDGKTCYKIFHSGAKWSSFLSQNVNLSKGEWVFTPKVNVHFDGWNPDINDLEDVIIDVYAGSVQETFLMRHFLNREYVELPVKFFANGETRIGIRITCRWEHSRSVFLDDFQLEMVGETEPEPEPGPCRGKPRTQYKRVVNLLPQTATLEQVKFVAEKTFANRQTILFSEDDAGIGDLDSKSVIAWGYPKSKQNELKSFFDEFYPGTVVVFVDFPAEQKPDSPIDLLPYIAPESAFGPIYELKHSSGNQQRVQHQKENGKVYIVKDSEWEELEIDSQYVWRGIDTSPGKGRFYVQYEQGREMARWCKRFMSVGETFIGFGHKVQFFNKSDCSKSAENSGWATNKITLANHYKEYKGFKDVVELKGEHESWFFSKGVGMIGWFSSWGSSWVSEIHQPGQRPNNTRETICRFTL